MTVSKKFDGLLDKIEKQLDQAAKMKFKGFQPVSVFREWEVGETRNINGTLNTLIYKTEDHFCFFTVIPPSSKFKTHWHDWIECCYVVQGLLGDENQPDKKWRMGEVCRYKLGEVHTPKNLLDMDLKLFVHFRNPYLHEAISRKS